jgi:N-dimethylarginine dimethylaminohydrolase
MKFTSHSEYHKLQSVMIKPVANAFVSEGLLAAQWRSLHFLAKPEFKASLKEYADFEAILKNRDIDVLHLPMDSGLSIDSIYCRDASIATDFGMIICNMGKPDRKMEPAAQRAYFEDNNILILGEISEPGTLEGGDVAWLDKNTLAVGHTYRTNASGIEQLKKLLEPRGVKIIVADLPHYKGPSDVFHLMSIFSPVAKDLAVVYSPLMPVAFRNELIKRGVELVEVPENEFDTMGCNVLAIEERTCIMLKGNPVTEQKLLEAGCEVFTYEGANISVMGGGGPTCLTRPLRRSFS